MGTSALIVAETEPPPIADGSLALALTEVSSLGIALAGLAMLCVVLATVRYGLDAFSRSKLTQTLTAGPARTAMERKLGDLDRMRVATMLLWVLAESGILLLTIQIIGSLSGSSPLSLLPLSIGLAVTTVFQVFFLRIVPRLLVTREPEVVMARVLPLLHLLGVLMSPIVVPMSFARRLVSRALKIPAPTTLDESFSEELRAKVAEAERDGVVEEDEAEMIENVVEFRDVSVWEVMTPRTDVNWIRADETVMSALQIASDKGHSRMPVGEEDSDHIIGVFYVRDVIGRIAALEDLRSLNVRDFCRRPFFVPESKSVKALFKEFRESKVHIAIALDEYGGTAGLITVEDILEEIVGEIDDEYDTVSTEALDRIDRDHAQVDGRTRIDELNDLLEIELPESDDFDTVGGLVFTRLGRIPEVGEVLALEGVDVAVLEADERRVKRVELTVHSRNGSPSTSE